MHSPGDLIRFLVCLPLAIGGQALLCDAAWAIAHGQASGSGSVQESSTAVDVSSVGVDEASGAATLSIPVELPPGPNGQRPELAVSYSSERGNGLLGVGWGLGFPRIECSARFGVPRYVACERFELNGQALVGPDATGAYHTFDESFSRIERTIASDSHTAWSVTSTDGVRATFGGDPGSRLVTPMGTVEWHVSRIEDVFGNRVEFEYTPGPAGQEGELRPSRIRYAEGHREILFRYESRPDPAISYRGGVRRSLSERLQEIQVFVNDQLHHRLVLSYEIAQTTTQSRLISIQRFGSDCDPTSHPNPTPGTCSALPAAEFFYTDAGGITAEERWVDTGEPAGLSSGPPFTPPWYAPVRARFSTGDGFLRGQNTQFTDINGDGLPDIVTDETGRHDDQNLLGGSYSGGATGAAAGPFVHLNNGVDGWEEPTWNGGLLNPNQSTNIPDNESALWTDRIRALRFDIPAMRVKQVFSFLPSTRPNFHYVQGPGYEGAALGSCINQGEALPAVEFLEDAGSVQSGARQVGGSVPYFDSSAFRNFPPGHFWAPETPYDVPAESEIRVWPHFQFVDLNADGLADLVMSVRLSGFYLSMDDCVSRQVQPVANAQWIPGADARVVFMNTGDLSGSGETFLRDDGRNPEDGNYADSLPLFGIVAFESGDLAYEEIGKGQLKENWFSSIATACDDYGLAGLRESAVNSTPFATSWDFCIVPIDLTPVFEDLNGDGYPDLVVRRPFDPTKPGNPDYADGLFYDYDPGPPGEVTNFEPVHRVGALESVAWLQDPQAAAGQDRWVRAPAYDPPIDHSFVAQFGGESPHGGQVPATIDSRGNAQIYNIDNGVRFADLNRDGLSDMLVSPRIASLMTEFPAGAALINRGAQDPAGGARFSAWCTSKSLAGIDLCADADRYTPPKAWVDGFVTYDQSWGGGLGTIIVTPNTGLVSLADFNGDGWIDMLLGGGANGFSEVFLHNPGASGSVWLQDDRFSPRVPRLYLDAPGGVYDGTSIALPTGYAIADVNGDGVADLVGSDRDFMPHKHSFVSTPESAWSDLLEEYRNGQGLAVHLAYTGALQQRDAAFEARALAHAMAPLEDGAGHPENDGLAEPPGPDPVWPDVDDDVRWRAGPVLASKTVVSPNRAATETTFKYAHPRRCHKHKTSQGYRLVEQVHGDGSRVETFYYQKHGRTGKLAEETIYDESGHPVRHRSAVWELPDPSTVAGGFADLASTADFNVAYIGRLASRMSRNEYGAFVGEAPGFTTTTTFEYDDVHGYNFVGEIVSDVPGRSARTLRQPEPIDFANHLTDRVHRIQIFADQGPDQRLLSDEWLSYRDANNRTTWDKVGMRRVFDASRDDPDTARWALSYSIYSSQGNLIEERQHLEDSASSESRSTFYCYDGDPGCAAGHGSRSILVGTRNAHGRWTRSEPHPVFADTARSWSDYADVPTLRFEFDPLGRSVEQWLEPADGSTPVRLSETRYEDFPTPQGGSPSGPLSGPIPPYQVVKRFAEAGAPSAIETISVSDALGGVALSIDLLEPASSGVTPVVATAIEKTSDRNARVSAVSEPFACAPVGALDDQDDAASLIAACTAVAAEGKPGTTSTYDALGRPVKVVTPLGVERLRYSATELGVLGSGRRTPHDVVLRLDANGGLEETVLAGEKRVRLRECNNPAPVSDLASAVCLDADETRLIYEPTGELRERIDPTLANNGSFDGFGVGPFSNQILRFLRDTRGRIVRIDDPDAGRSRLAYDVFGNLLSSIDARDVEVRNEYDALDRLTRVEVDGETPTEIRYDEDLLKRERVVDGTLDKLYAYDDLGRVWREIRWVDGHMMKIDFQRDYLDRVTRIQYPTVLNELIDTIAYEYDGAFLARVCDLAAVGSFDQDCDSEAATPLIREVVYDALGRVAEVELPGGTRRFTYHGNSRRRTSDAFDSNLPGGGEDVFFSYRMEGGTGPGLTPAYDGLGNLLRVEATIADQSYSMDYAYDARNRIDSWTWDPQGSGSGTQHDFAYDARGNMVLHAGDPQDYASFTSAHAIQSRVSNGVTTNYAYDPAGHLKSTSSATAGTRHYRYDGRGRLVCIGTSVDGCDRLAVTYNGEGERVKEAGPSSYLFAGPDFRLKPAASGRQEYWIEVHAFGQRIAYKHGLGGALRVVGATPGWEVSPTLMAGARILGLALIVGLGLCLLVLVGSNPSPARSGVSAALILLASFLPLQARGASLMRNPHVSGSAVYRFVMSDMIGSGAVEIDAAGQTLSHTAYRPFGVVAEQSGSGGVGGRAYFAGHDRQLMNGLVYMNARWMDPASGTFMSVDPMIPDGRDPQSYNGYSYARNNPVSLVDPRGTDWRVVWRNPETGKVVSKGPWQSGSSSKAQTFVNGVRSGAITVATIAAGLAQSGGSEQYGIPAAVVSGNHDSQRHAGAGERSAPGNIQQYQQRLQDRITAREARIAGNDQLIEDLYVDSAAWQRVFDEASAYEKEQERKIIARDPATLITMFGNGGTDPTHDYWFARRVEAQGHLLANQMMRAELAALNRELAGYNSEDRAALDRSRDFHGR